MTRSQRAAGPAGRRSRVQRTTLPPSRVGGLTLDRRHLEYFLAVAECGSISAAARQMGEQYVTEPSNNTKKKKRIIRE